jgi:hypothetical protein
MSVSAGRVKRDFRERTVHQQTIYSVAAGREPGCARAREPFRGGLNSRHQTKLKQFTSQQLRHQVGANISRT